MAASSPSRVSRLPPRSKPWAPPSTTTVRASCPSSASASAKASCCSSDDLPVPLAGDEQRRGIGLVGLGQGVGLGQPTLDHRVLGLLRAAEVLGGVLHRAVVGVVEADEGVDLVGDVGPQLVAGEPRVVRGAKARRRCGTGGVALDGDAVLGDAQGVARAPQELHGGLDVLLGEGEHRRLAAALGEQVVGDLEGDVALGVETPPPALQGAGRPGHPRAAVDEHDGDVALVVLGAAQLALLGLLGGGRRVGHRLAAAGRHPGVRQDVGRGWRRLGGVVRRGAAGGRLPLAGSLRRRVGRLPPSVRAGADGEGHDGQQGRERAAVPQGGGHGAGDRWWRRRSSAWRA